MEGYPSMYNNPSWESSSSSPTDHPSVPFHSALTSLVSSPDFIINTTTADNDNSLMRELIGRLGTISTSPDPIYCSAPNSASTSCYSTPLNSPPKLGLSLMERNSRTGGGGGGFGYPATHLHLPADSGFVDRAARFSCFDGGNVTGGQPHQGGFPGLPPRQVERVESGRFSRVSSSQNVTAGFRNGNSHENMETGDSPAGSSISEQITRPSDGNASRKRKFVPRGKAKYSAKDSPKDGEDCAENGQVGEKKRKDDNVKPPEPPKDYIHVRARRGQATDSHSLAERVRREKISQRMKVLQDLVPGCSKVTGKAVMLDEIINYVQSLQRQVEFLSMKLATLNPRMDFNADSFVSKEMCNPQGSSLFPGDSSSSAFPYAYQMQLHDTALIIKMENQLPLNALNIAVHPSMDGFCEASSTVVSGLWEDELHSIVQMGLQQNQPHHRLQGAPAAGQMKIES